MTDYYKRCSRCHEYQPREEYRPSRTDRDGLSAWCKSCFRVYQKEWYRIVAGPTEEEIKILVKKVGKERAEKSLELDRKIRENLTHNVIGFWRYLHFEDSVLAVQVKEEKRVLKILAEDPDIRECLHKEIKSFEADAREEFENVVSWREWFEKL